MKFQNEDLYRKLEIDIPITMDRFMNNEEMYIQFLKKFTENMHFEELHQAISSEQWAEALRISHNLKSVTGNLSLTNLHKLFASQVADFRANKMDEAVALMANIDEERERVLGIIKEFK